MFQACTALTELNLSSWSDDKRMKFSAQVKETSYPEAHLTHIESRLQTCTNLSLPVMVQYTTPALLFGLVVCAFACMTILCAEMCPDLWGSSPWQQASQSLVSTRCEALRHPRLNQKSHHEAHQSARLTETPPRLSLHHR